MGEVYRARDDRVGRDVAIKVSAERFSDRFELEAIAAPNYPNICQLHDVGPNYLVMELIEGESLTGPLSRRASARIRPADRRRPRSRPRKRHRPSRPQTDQHQVQARWHGQGAGLRAGEDRGHGGGRCRKLAHHDHVADTRWHDSLDRAVHESGAGAGEADRSAHGYLGVQRSAVRQAVFILLTITGMVTAAQAIAMDTLFDI
jgi:hypothetical protein